MDSRIIVVLERLKQNGFTSSVNIAPVLNDIFPYPTEADEGLFNHSRESLILFVDGLFINKLISYNRHNLDIVTNYRDFQNRTDWFGDYALVASITIDGLRYLLDEQRGKKDAEVSNSIIATNQSVKDTNGIVQSVSKTQKMLAFISLTIVAISTVYLVLTYYKSDSPALEC